MAVQPLHPQVERRGALGFALKRLKTAIAPDVEVTPPPTEVQADWDVEVPMRDGVKLRVNIFRPADGRPAPVIMCAHPYGKDLIPARTVSGKSPPFQYRIFPQPERVRFSAWTSWESPDPAVYVANGFALVNCDLRGAGHSEGVGDFFSEQEGQDYHDLIEWAAAQPWSTGKIGLDGVSYLCISQYFGAAEHPSHLVAICPWEGVSDVYRDFAYPGGVKEIGFSKLWFHESGKARTHADLAVESARRDRDEFWASRAAPIERIAVPMLVCASFSDHSLHTRGSFNAFARASSQQNWVYTHRGGKWSRYYSEEATRTRLNFFDYFLKAEDNGWERLPPVRLEIYDTGGSPAAIVAEDSFPPSDLEIRKLWLDPGARVLGAQPPVKLTQASFKTRGSSLRLTWRIDEDIDIIGPMALKIPLSVKGADDLNLFAGIRKFRRGVEIHFEGTFGFSRDLVTKGWQRAQHRTLDPEQATALQPVHLNTQAEPLAPGELVTLDVELRQHATRFMRGDTLQLELRGDWFFARDPLRGQFPGYYEPSRKARATVYSGPGHDAYLLFGARPVGLTTAKAQSRI